MPRLTKIYTRKGDDGTTALGTKKRVSKSDLRIHAYGTVDELNSVIGLTLTKALDDKHRLWLQNIQNTLFHLGSELAFPPDEVKEFKIPLVEQRHIDALESWIDALSEKLGSLENFVMPGGSEGAAALHLCRTVSRRTERLMVELALNEPVRSAALGYINRLSDLFFMLARAENAASEVEETSWDSHA